MYIPHAEYSIWVYIYIKHLYTYLEHGIGICSAYIISARLKNSDACSKKTLTARFVHEVQSAESSGQTLRASQSYIVGGISQIIQEYVNFVVAHYRPILSWLTQLLPSAR